MFWLNHLEYLRYMLRQNRLGHFVELDEFNLLRAIMEVKSIIVEEHRKGVLK